MKKTQFYFLMIMLVIFICFITLGGLGNAAYKYDGFYWVSFALNILVYGYLIHLLNLKRKEAEIIDREEADEKLKEMMKKDSANHPKVKTFKNK